MERTITQDKTYKIRRGFRILLIVAAYGYLAYSLLTFKHYGEFAAHFHSAGWKELFSFALAVLLFPLNISMESEKWRCLLSYLTSLSRQESQRLVYFGFVGALLTPDRLGDYPARASMLQEGVSKKKAVALGFAGSMVLAGVNIGNGVVTLLKCSIENPSLVRW